jgi:HD-GYP domain-containing protein (c-di-GMP phosphodiesterase class II)
VCDAYEAMTADRPYRRARSSEAACDELRASAGTQFDPEVVDVFVVEISGRGTADAETTNETEWPVQALAARVRTLLSQPEALLSERRLG